MKKKANGAVFDAINSRDIAQEIVRVPNKKVILHVENLIRPYMDTMKSKSIENLKLIEMRDSFLPRLISGEMKINDLTC